jgi:hypothetical protein
MSKQKETATLFSHIKAITETQDPKYWDKLDEPSKKTFSNFMIHRFLSMNSDWIELIAELQPYTEILEPREMYLAYIGIIPRGKYYLRYVKGKKESKYESWLIDLIKIDYMCNTTQALDYCEILYATKPGREHIKYICEKYGTDPKKITSLKLKL